MSKKETEVLTAEVTTEVLTEKDKELVIAITQAEAQAITDKIKLGLEKVGRGYLTVAGDVYKLKATGAYEILGYSTIYECCKEMFGMARGTTSDLINIVKRFYDMKTMKILPDYKNISFMKLNALRKLDDEELNGVKEEIDIEEASVEEVQSYCEPKQDGEKKKKAGTVVITEPNSLKDSSLLEQIIELLESTGKITIRVEKKKEQKQEAKTIPEQEEDENEQ